MKPAQSILDISFRYVPATSTSVAQTWRRFGWRPAAEEARKRWRRLPLDRRIALRGLRNPDFCA